MGKCWLKQGVRRLPHPLLHSAHNVPTDLAESGASGHQPERSHLQFPVHRGRYVPAAVIRCHTLDATARGCAFILRELKAGRVYYRKEHRRLKLFLVFFVKHCLLVTVRVSMLDQMDF